MAEEPTEIANVQTEQPSAGETAPAAPTTGTAPGSTTGGNQAQPQTERTFSQADVDRIVKERLEREQGKATKAAEKARAEAEAKALAEQGDFKALSERQAKHIAELETQAADLAAAQAQLAKYEKALKTNLAAQLAGVPEHIQTLLNRMDVTEQMEWIAANQDKLKPASAPAAPNIDATQRSTSPRATMTDAEKREFAARYGVRPEFLPS